MELGVVLQCDRSGCSTGKANDEQVYKCNALTVACKFEERLCNVNNNQASLWLGSFHTAEIHNDVCKLSFHLLDCTLFITLSTHLFCFTCFWSRDSEGLPRLGFSVSVDTQEPASIKRQHLRYLSLSWIEMSRLDFQVQPLHCWRHTTGRRKDLWGRAAQRPAEAPSWRRGGLCACLCGA